MCLILFRFQPDSPQSLVVAANRDEFYARPALAAHYWQDRPGIFAGRDLTAGGSWLGVTRSGRFAALTNFSAGDPVQTYPASRGELVADFLASHVAADAYIKSLEPTRYAGFNLLVYDGKELHYTTNKGFPSEKLSPGTYGLSNAELSADWPKATDGAATLAQTLDTMPAGTATIPGLLQVLTDSTPPADNRLPVLKHTKDLPLERRRALGARFISGEDYGTRAMTVVTISNDRTDVFEQQLGAQGRPGTAIFARLPRQAS